MAYAQAAARAERWIGSKVLPAGPALLPQPGRAPQSAKAPQRATTPQSVVASQPASTLRTNTPWLAQAPSRPFIPSVAADQARTASESRLGAESRTVVLASGDTGLRQRMRETLLGLRWQVLEAGGGAEAMAHMEQAGVEAIVLDSWLPDLEVGEFAGQVRVFYPGVEIVRVDSPAEATGVRSPRRNELLHALREAQKGELVGVPEAKTGSAAEAAQSSTPLHIVSYRTTEMAAPRELVRTRPATAPGLALPEMIGGSKAMLELARLIRLVAPKTATVLIEGETGTGKEVVAKALHRLSARANKVFCVLNCAAIPESLLEAELFGHARGAFTGAVQSRTGRIEAAHGGTLFLDEIGEMPLALQAKMLRFLESGELQRVGDNEITRVDVRIIAATHQPLEQRSEEQRFRLDLYHRLAVFPIEVPALRDRMDDLPALAEFFLEQMGREAPRKRLTAEAMELLLEHGWPGNVRELKHVLERAAILSGDQMEIGSDEIRLRREQRRG